MIFRIFPAELTLIGGTLNPNSATTGCIEAAHTANARVAQCESPCHRAPNSHGAMVSKKNQCWRTSDNDLLDPRLHVASDLGTLRKKCANGRCPCVNRCEQRSLVTGGGVIRSSQTAGQNPNSKTRDSSLNRTLLQSQALVAPCRLGGPYFRGSISQECPQESIPLSFRASGCRLSRSPALR